MSDTIGELSAVELPAAIREKKVSARQALAAHLERIAQVNPVIIAVVTLDPAGARNLAHRADQRTASGAELPPLHGLPMTLKATTSTAGMRTTQGSLALRDFIPDAD